ncbi:hypothetical protein JCM30471_17220 [Desulfuromonas carbonis]|uniref:UbiA family prenyltransferase n=1 Tax=Desulfuromonas sp. DDH964 TaxID=1823759 RepID=UPI00078E8BD2|nr:UbiA family prenyltransferase [Desulfuromonas sp. DDH964]AMV73320.1 protoheme IX farnesyltransferase [Desulfuromonas sp. DDH964]
MNADPVNPRYKALPAPLWPTRLGRLTRYRLSLAVAASTGAGALLAPTPPQLPLLLLAFAGTGLLAAAGSALNQVQERDLDARMLRTCQRPLPAGQITPGGALALAAAIALCGLALLATTGPLPLLLGLAALCCYNGLYTPLKRRTPLALLAGAGCGALPPLIGWSAAGGALTDFRILLLIALLYLWQLPHFWRLAEKHAADYRRAGLPLLQDRLDPQLARLARQSWSLAAASVALLLPLFGLLQAPWARVALIFIALLLALSAWLRRPAGSAGPAWADLAILLLFLLLIGDRFATAPALLQNSLLCLAGAG